MPDTTTEVNPRLERQQSLSLHLPKGVAVVGCGGVGSWIALMLALAGVNNLWLFDPDNVGEHNLNRLPLPPSAVGRSKTHALAEAITALRPECAPVPMSALTRDVATLTKLETECNWLVCSTDSLASRQLAYAWCQEYDVAYIEAAAEGDTGSIAAEPAEWSTPEETQPGYASVPVWVGPCVNAAAMACAHILHNVWPYQDRVLRIGWDANNGLTMFDSQAQQGSNPVGSEEEVA